MDRIQELTGKEFVLHGTCPRNTDVVEVRDVIRGAA